MTDKQTVLLTDTELQTDRQFHRRRTVSQTDSMKHRQTVLQIDRMIEKCLDKPTDKHTDRQTDKRNDRWVDRLND